MQPRWIKRLLRVSIALSATTAIVAIASARVAVSYSSVCDRDLILAAGQLCFRPAGRPGVFVRESGEGLRVQWHTMKWRWIPDWGRLSWQSREISLLALPFAAAFPTAFFWWRSARLPTHACPKCSYDLRGTPISADNTRVCPECGTRAAHVES